MKASYLPPAVSYCKSVSTHTAGLEIIKTITTIKGNKKKRTDDNTLFIQLALLKKNTLGKKCCTCKQGCCGGQQFLYK